MGSPKTVKGVPVTPRLLREEAEKARKYMREPGIAPWVLEWVAGLIDVGEIGLELPCPKCERACRACSGAHPGYNIQTSMIVDIVIVDYLCPDCPHVWAVWQPMNRKEKDRGDKSAKQVRDADCASDQE